MVVKVAASVGFPRMVNHSSINSQPAIGGIYHNDQQQWVKSSTMHQHGSRIRLLKDNNMTHHYVPSHRKGRGLKLSFERVKGDNRDMNQKCQLQTESSPAMHGQAADNRFIN